MNKEEGQKGNALERYIEADKPDYVVIEKVERNITDYLDNPPITTPALAELPKNILIKDTNTIVSVETCDYDTNYFTISGEVDKVAISEKSEIFKEVYTDDSTGEKINIEE